MKKGIIGIIAFFSLLVIAGAVFADAEYDAALKAYAERNYKEAAVQLKAYVEKKPDPAAYYLLGYSLYELGRYNEATEYFEQAYLINPEFSPEQLRLGKTLPKMRGKRHHRHHAVRKPKEAAAKIKPAGTKSKGGISGPAGKAAVAATTGIKAPVAARPAPPKGIPAKETKPEKTMTHNVKPASPAKIPAVPMTKKGRPGPVSPSALPLIVGSFLAGFFFLTVAIGIILYLYFALCLFFIARKREVPYPWTAWVPLVQVWPFVESAGKPLWLIILLLVPFINIVVALYLWMCISENLGKNKWLGLLMILPVINFVFLGFLAFSKAESHGSLETDVPE
jgi:tetratricopeptide (TPR) repeat protein